MPEAKPAAALELSIARVFDAPRERVFDAWIDPAQLTRWWGPAGFSTTFHAFEPTPGGLWRFTMHGPDGADYENEVRFVEVARPERIVLEHLSEPRFRIIAAFEDLDGRTRLRFRQVFESEAALASVRPFAERGNAENMERLAAVLADR